MRVFSSTSISSTTSTRIGVSSVSRSVRVALTLTASIGMPAISTVTFAVTTLSATMVTVTCVGL